MTDESKLKAEFLERLANPNKEKLLKQMETFVSDYSSMIKHITYISYDRGVHNILLVSTSLSDMLNVEFMERMNKVIPGSSVKDAKQDKVNGVVAYVIQVYE